MAPRFDRMDRLLNRAVDRAFSRRFRIVPFRRVPMARSEPDDTREPFEGDAIFSNRSIESGVQLGVRKSYRESNDLRALQTSSQPMASVQNEQLMGGVVQGDRMSFPGSDLPIFTIVSVQSDGQSRTRLVLVREDEYQEES